MKRILLLIIGLGGALLFTGHTWAQVSPAPKKDSITRMYRLYEDDDYLNFWGHGTDNAYTNGSRIDYFYQPADRPHGMLGKFAPRAGDSSIDIYSWGVMELMYTPNYLTRTDWQPHDYQYAGALIALHSLYSYNPVKHFDFQTEVVMGIIGPSAMAKEIQTDFHRLIRYTIPRGWGHQYRNDALLNINFTAEKQLLAVGNGLRVIAGGQVYGGTMQNGAAVYPLILIGKMNPYFNGFFSQYNSPACVKGGRTKWQGYLLFKPELQFYLQNALLQGGMFTHNPNLQQSYEGSKGGATQSDGSFHQGDGAPPKIPDLQQWLTSFTYGFVVTHSKFGISITNHVSSAMMKGLYCHTEGNISLYFGW